jgi:hypothetical protein
MKASTGQGRVSRLPLGLFTMLVLIFACESFFARNALSFRRSWVWDWEISRGNAVSNAKDCDVLCFGDSLVKFSVLPRVLKKRGDLRAYNLAINAGPISASFIQFRRAIEAGARPKAVIVDFTFLMLPHTILGFEDLMPYLLNTRDCAEMASTIHDASFFGRVMLKRALPSIRDRNEIRANILEAFRGEANTRPAITWAIMNWSENLGAQVMPPTPRRADEPLFTEGLQAHWEANHDNLVYLRRFLRLAASRDIRVYWLLPPIDPDLQERRDREGLDDKFLSVVNEMVRRYPNLVVLDARHAQYKKELHIDPIHLDRRGAALLSSDIANALRQPPPSHRWLVMPKYADRNADELLRDMEQSIVADASSRNLKR